LRQAELTVLKLRDDSILSCLQDLSGPSARFEKY
jgi:hypothetical protein